MKFDHFFSVIIFYLSFLMPKKQKAKRLIQKTSLMPSEHQTASFCLCCYDFSITIIRNEIGHFFFHNIFDFILVLGHMPWEHQAASFLFMLLRLLFRHNTKWNWPFLLSQYFLFRIGADHMSRGSTKQHLFLFMLQWLLYHLTIFQKQNLEKTQRSKRKFGPV